MATGNEKKFELKIGKTGILVVVVGMTALLCASFLFGIDVGQNMETYPEKIASIPQRALALVWRPAKIKLAQQNASRDNTMNSPSSDTQEATGSPVEDNIDLTYHQTLTSKKGLAHEDSFAEKKTAVASQKNEEEIQKGKFHIETRVENTNQNKDAAGNQTLIQKESVKEPVQKKEVAKIDKQISTKSASKNVEQKEIVNKKKAVKEKEPIKQQDTKQSETGDQGKVNVTQKFIVQVASLKDKSTAYKMNKEIASLGFQSKIIKTEIKGKGILYRLVVSDLRDKEHAQKAAKKISAKTGKNCMIKTIEIKNREN